MFNEYSLLRSPSTLKFWSIYSLIFKIWSSVNSFTLLELEISKLEETVANARIIDESDINTDKVSILSKVKIENLNLKKEFQYTIVSEEESNLEEGKISIKSPIGMGLLGKKKGEIVSVNVPSGKIQFKIIEIFL